MDCFSDPMECSPLRTLKPGSKAFADQRCFIPTLLSPMRPKKRLKTSHTPYLSTPKKDNDEYADDFKDVEYFGTSDKNSEQADDTLVKTSPLLPGTLQFLSPFRDEDSNTTVSSACSESISGWSLTSQEESLPTCDLWPPTFGTPTARYTRSANYVNTSHPKGRYEIDFASFNEDLKNKKLAGELMFDSPDYVPPPRPLSRPFLSPPPKVRLTQSAEFTPSERKRKRDLLLSPDLSDEEDLDFMEPHELMKLINNGSERYYIVDGRYSYEFEGGHIINALHLPYREQIKLLFERIKTIRCTVIFHCEKSLVRGPRAARYFDELIENEANCEVKVKVLFGGYSKFYRTKTSQDYITPKGFTRELSKAFTLRKRAAREKVNQTWKTWRKQRMEKKRSQSFCM